MNKDIFKYKQSVTKEDKVKLTKQKPCVLWFTGLSGSGKSTIANAIEKLLFKNENFTQLLDGDNIRNGLNKDLGFDEASRVENIRRIGEVTKLFIDSGYIILSAFISPFIDDREIVKQLLNEDEFIEIFVDAPLNVCESRDTKGLYKKARDGKIKDFTGINSPYEKPLAPHIHIETKNFTVEESCEQILEYLYKNNYIKQVNKTK